jgi:hypothetical protein
LYGPPSASTPFPRRCGPPEDLAAGAVRAIVGCCHGQLSTGHAGPRQGHQQVREDPLVLPHCTTTADELSRRRSPPPPEHQSPVSPVSMASRPWVTSRGAERFLEGAWTHWCSCRPWPPPPVTLSPEPRATGRLPCSADLRKRTGASPLSVSLCVSMTGGPNRAAGPTCQRYERHSWGTRPGAPSIK